MKRIDNILNFKYSIVLLFLFATTILKAQPPVASFTITNNMCLGDQGNYGDASSGAPDTWSWYFQGGVPSSSTLQYPPNIDYFTPGTYEVKLVVSNIYGADSTTQYVNVFDVPTLSLNTTNVTCFGMADGSAEAIAAGGSSPYFYAWSSGGFNAVENNLSAGNHTVTVTDANNCQVVSNVTITEPPALIVNLNDESICSGNSGSLSAITSGGVSPYTYLWNDPLNSTTSVMTDYPTSTTNYEVTVTDAVGCTSNENANIFVNPPLTLNVNTNNVTCNGMNDGNITVTMAGGVSPYNYLWSPGGETTSTITNLSAGNYTVTVTDAIGCQVVDNVNVTEPTLITITMSDESICPGDTGSLTAFPSGGTPPYTYSWNDPLLTTVDIMTDYPAVTTNYEVTVTDANGCTSNDNADLTVYDAPILNVYDTAICEGGTISLVPDISGGTPPFNYLWMPGGTTSPTLVESPVDTTIYTLNIFDANNCFAGDDAVVAVNPAPIANASFMSLCEDTLGQSEFDLTLLNNSVNGGTGNTVSWYEDPGLTQYISGASAFVSGSTTLYVDVESPELCHSYASVQLIVKDSTTNVIKGSVNFQSSPITAGNVKLIRKNGILPSEMELVQINSVNTNGEFLFLNVPQGNYIVKAYGDTLLYDNIPTYSGDVSDWASAMEYSVVATCDDTVSIGIELMVEPTNSGLGSISGILIQDDGQGLFNKAPGDPIPDIDITIDQSPGGATMSATTTDINGYFTFTGLAAGDYIIYADMLGYTTTPQILSFDGSNMNQDVTLCSNDTLTTVDVCSSITTLIASLPNSNLFNIYPNPASDKLTIEFDGSEKVEISIIDMQGRLVLKENNLKSYSTLDVSNLSNGVYQLKFVGTNSYSIQKILIQR
jgi:PKD repeat protein